MAADAAWILSGSDKVADIEGYNKNVVKYSDDGITFFGAYGPKIIGQLDYVVQALLDENTSRRAVLTIWRESPPHTKDTPCTISTQFLIRNGYLNTVVTMRSSDSWIGLPYDLFTFTMLSGVVFLMLRDRGLRLKGLGALHNYAGSRHLYEQDVARIKELDFTTVPGEINKDESLTFNVNDFNYQCDLVDHLWAVARGEKQNMKTSFMRELMAKEKS
jgi:thymidylate synthase